MARKERDGGSTHGFCWQSHRVGISLDWYVIEIASKTILWPKSVPLGNLGYEGRWVRLVRRIEEWHSPCNRSLTKGDELAGGEVVAVDRDIKLTRSSEGTGRTIQMQGGNR